MIRRFSPISLNLQGGLKWSDPPEVDDAQPAGEYIVPIAREYMKILQSSRKNDLINRRKLIGLCVMTVLWGGPLFSQGLFESPPADNSVNMAGSRLSLGGFIRSTGYLATDPADHFAYLQSAYGEAGILLEAKTGIVASARADLRIRAGTEFRKPLREWMIREAWVDFSGHAWGFRFGKMIAPWGKGTVFNPVDKITPMDPTRRSPDEDDMLLGFWGAEGHVNLGSYATLTATWKPLYQPSVLLIDPVPMPGYVEFIESWDPGVSLSEGSYGIVAGLHHPVADAGLYWFEGYHTWPGIGLDTFILDLGSMEPETLKLMERPYRIMMFGLDFSVPVGSWMIRAEGAWQQSKEERSGREYIPFPELAYTVEIERSAGAFDLIAGYYGKHILEYEAASAPPSLSPDRDYFMQLANMPLSDPLAALDDLVRNQLEAFNRLYNYQLKATYHSVFLVPRGNFLHNMLEASIPVVYNFTTEEWILQPQVSVKPVDGLAISAGFSGFYGPEDSLYDLVGPVLNAGYLSLKFSF